MLSARKAEYTEITALLLQPPLTATTTVFTSHITALTQLGMIDHVVRESYILQQCLLLYSVLPAYHSLVQLLSGVLQQLS
jgi:hypothetical protein